MKMIVVSASILVCALCAAGPVAAQDVFVYPSKGQSDEQMMRDKEQCHEWSVNQTGVDPEKVASAPPSSSSSGAGSALGGAGMGAVRGAVSGEAGAGAVEGFGIGRLVHAIRARRQMEQQQQAAAQEQEQKQAQLQKYDRAFNACLTGRGYTVQ